MATRFGPTRETRLTRYIERQLGVTAAGLEALAIGVANDGPMPGGSATVALKNAGLAVWAGRDMGGWLITDRGRAVVAAARRLGF